MRLYNPGCKASNTLYTTGGGLTLSCEHMSCATCGHDATYHFCIPCSPLREIKGATFSVTFSSFRKLILFHRVRGHNLLNVSYIAVSGQPELEENDYTPVTPQKEHVTVGAIISRQ